MGNKDRKIRKGTGKPGEVKIHDHVMNRFGLGFDPVLDLIDDVEGTYTFDSLSKVPPFNIKKITDIDYLIEVSLPGVKRDDISAMLDEDYLTVSATVAAAADPEGDDVFLHRGIFQGGKFDAKFVIAKNLQHNYSEYVDGILSVYFVDKNVKRVATRLAIGPFPKPDTTYVVDYTSSGSPVLVPAGEPLTSDSAVPLTPTEPVEAPAPAADLPPVSEELPAPTDVSVVVDSSNAEVPTTEVVLPVELPQIVEVVVPELPVAVDAASPEPQVTLEVKDATFEIVADDVVTEVIKTPEGSADIVVAVPTEVHEALTEAGIDPVAAVETAIEAATSGEVVTLPAPSVEVTEPETTVVETPALSVEVPAELPAVVVLEETPASTEEAPAVTLDVTAEATIPADAVLVPVVTPEGQSDIVVAVPAELHETLTDAGVDVAAEIGAALEEAHVEVVTTETPTVTEIVNVESTEAPTVEVVLPEELPQVVEITVPEVPAVVDVASPEPQVVLEVNDATHEIVSDNVVTEIIKTEEDKADIVVAVDADLHAQLAEAGIDPVATVEAAIEQSEVVTPPELPAIPAEVTTDTVVVEPVTAEEPVTVVVPDAIPSVVEVKVEDGNVVLVDASASIPEEATITPVVTDAGDHDIVVVTTPETEVALAEVGVPAEAIADVVAEAVNVSEPPVVTAGSDAPADAVTLDTVTTVVNAEDTSTPTVEVTVPAELPQIVEVKLEEVVPTADASAPEPQAAITLEDATYEIKADDATLSVVPTEEGKADLVIAFPDEVKVALEDAGLSIEKDILPAIEAAVKPEIVADPVLVEEPKAELVPVEVVPAEAGAPETAIEVATPDVVTPVMTAEVVVADDLGKTIELKSADEAIPADAELLPIVTPEGQNDIVVAVTPEVKELLAETDVTVTEALTKAVNEAEVTVVEAPVISEEEKSELQ